MQWKHCIRNIRYIAVAENDIYEKVRLVGDVGVVLPAVVQQG
jgi:hypothetical protein